MAEHFTFQRIRAQFDELEAANVELVAKLDRAKIAKSIGREVHQDTPKQLERLAWRFQRDHARKPMGWDEFHALGVAEQWTVIEGIITNQATPAGQAPMSAPVDGTGKIDREALYSAWRDRHQYGDQAKLFRRIQVDGGDFRRWRRYSERFPDGSDVAKCIVTGLLKS